jgi:HAD superfamily phosphoserine phosphatase-like hydrolase
MINKKIVCFDVDGTFVDGISWYILTEGLGCKKEEHEKIYRDCLDGKITFKEGESQLVKLYQQKGQANYETINQIFANVELREEVFNLMIHLREKGYLVYLISGAIDLYVQKIAEKIQANGWFANSSLGFDDQGNLIKLNYRDGQGKVKLDQLISLADKLKLDLKKDIYVVGDGENDLEIFQATGHGIAVYCENKELQKVAWKNVETLDEIINIL